MSEVRSCGLFGLCRDDGKQVNQASAVRTIMTSLVLAALTGIAAYYCITNGLNGLDRAYSSLAQFKASILIYAGASFGIASFVNSGFVLFGRADKDSLSDLKTHVALTVCAPVAAIVVGGYCFLQNRACR